MNGAAVILAAFGLAGVVTLAAADAEARDTGSGRRSEPQNGAGKERRMTPKTTAKGQTEVTVYKPASYDEPKDGPTLTEVQLAETFTGDIEGEGTARVLQAKWSDGTARYCTIERIVGALAGRRGSFLLQVDGSVQGKRNKGAWFVIAGSATGDLHGLRGDGGFEAEHGKRGSWTLDYWFE